MLLNKKIPLPSDTRKEDEVGYLGRNKELTLSTFSNENHGASESITSNKTCELQSSLAPFVDKKESERETIFYINNLPKPGLYKAQIFARRKPKKRGKLLIPLVACILLEYRHVRKCFQRLVYFYSFVYDVISSS